jgi:hypothetical protein
MIPHLVCFASTNSPIPSAIPNAQAASTLPPTYSTLVLPSAVPAALATLSSTSSKYFPAKTSKEVATLLPDKSSTVWIGPDTGTWTWREHFPKPSGRISDIWAEWVDSAIWSWPERVAVSARRFGKPFRRSQITAPSAASSTTTNPPVIPKETEPRATNRGMSAAGRNTLYSDPMRIQTTHSPSVSFASLSRRVDDNAAQGHPKLTRRSAGFVRERRQACVGG